MISCSIHVYFERPINATITLKGCHPGSEGEVWTLGGPGIDANTGTELPFPEQIKWARQAEARTNSYFRSGNPTEVGISSSALSRVSNQFDYIFPPHSVTSLVISVKELE